MQAFTPLRQRRSAWRFLLCVAAVSIAAAGCGDLAENLVEEGVEQAIEADSGEEFELDFDGEDGLTIETEEGTMTIEGDGSFTIEGQDGEVLTGESGEDGFTVTDEDGTAVLEIDEDDGAVTAETEDGTFTAGSGIPEDWPSSVPMPEGLSDMSGSAINADGQGFFSVAGTTDDASGYFDSYTSSLEDAGYERVSYFEADGIRQGTFEGSEFNVTVVANDDSQNVGINAMSIDG